MRKKIKTKKNVEEIGHAPIQAYKHTQSKKKKKTGKGCALIV